ncbi:MAG: TsaB protein required for threonylcarbamoyladenosine ((6)A) formation in tRNA [Sediminibacterium sp.]|nr:TsaB protein required for threonylcarbamoyladenosine ((6)A) formation in tRNA [Sediminibacterium sp.]
MPLLLNIDTATEHASVCISRRGDVLEMVASSEQKNHASFVQPAIQALLHATGLELSEMAAIAVTAGPGSYTGLRVGLASAKGICYVLGKPLIMVNTLEVMAQAAREYYQLKEQILPADTVFCPMIDARRMEVFTALFNPALDEIAAPHALVLDEGSFENRLRDHPMVFSGSGCHKLKTLVSSPNAHFPDLQHTAAHLASRALIAYESNRFADLAYSEPLYVKEFFNPAKPV